MKNVVIIGARGFGREVCMLLSLQSNYKTQYVVKGFLDDDKSSLVGYEGYPPILSSVEDYVIEPNDVFFCALGNPYYRKMYSQIILEKGGEFISCISETAFIFPNTKIGEGVFIGPFCTIDVDVEIGDFTTLISYCGVGHNSKIGNYCAIESFSALCGGAILHDEVTLHTRSTVLPKISIGEKTIVGAGSVVTRDVVGNVTVFGNPAISINFSK